MVWGAAEDDDDDALVAVSRVAHLELRVVGVQSFEVASIGAKDSLHVAQAGALERGEPRVRFDALAFLDREWAAVLHALTPCEYGLCPAHHASTGMFSSWMEECHRAKATGEVVVQYAIPLLAFESRRGKRGVLAVKTHGSSCVRRELSSFLARNNGGVSAVGEFVAWDSAGVCTFVVVPESRVVGVVPIHASSSMASSNGDAAWMLKSWSMRRGAV